MTLGSKENPIIVNVRSREFIDTYSLGPIEIRAGSDEFYCPSGKSRANRFKQFRRSIGDNLNWDYHTALNNFKLLEQHAEINHLLSRTPLNSTNHEIKRMLTPPKDLLPIKRWRGILEKFQSCGYTVYEHGHIEPIGWPVPQEIGGRADRFCLSRSELLNAMPSFSIAAPYDMYLDRRGCVRVALTGVNDKSAFILSEFAIIDWESRDRRP